MNCKREKYVQAGHCKCSTYVDTESDAQNCRIEVVVKHRQASGCSLLGRERRGPT
uniref:Uncharacterized protein n=1 Tax=Arion vulgaris TaxID=1028688 RepID=A0A0B7ADP9_9EUPU